ncbi:MAG: nickel pincer cofactor biosynthesis protein LarC [Bryobacteraceae bacterium]|nr:nickel pincer cofactor biosynthesis protein LarC [Bryobacterales bacterium]MEB2363184.1 nickel pincer cofactor biosynthesis protein LarC [Bryobacterales bacterium]NUN01514.1 nickel pincer cofactor biosynthesis protein LarC [Bryobacteraceae bacterium]
MKICYLDAFSGISGDMTVAALIDAGADAKTLIECLDSLETGASFKVEKTKRRGIAASKFHVEVEDTRAHRHLPQILRMIERAKLPDGAREQAAAIFQKLGEAEASVHWVPIEKVHFHEVGAVDSICDIVGAAVGFRLLDVSQVYCSPVNVGSGTVHTEHGVLPVPAPATAKLLSGKPVYSRGPEVELTTPTGAAIATTLAAGFGPMPPMRISSVGYGAGDLEFKEHANVLRILIGEASQATEATTVAVIEANIDDASPQMLGYAMERLFENGALDVTMTPLFMKKNRPGTLLSVIARPEDRERLCGLVFAETPTLGLRVYAAERRVEERKIVEVDTAHGKVRMKVSGAGFAAPEYEDCRRLASEKGIPLRVVLADATNAYLNKR